MLCPLDPAARRRNGWSSPSAMGKDSTCYESGDSPATSRTGYVMSSDLLLRDLHIERVTAEGRGHRRETRRQPLGGVRGERRRRRLPPRARAGLHGREEEARRGGLLEGAGDRPG